MPKIKTNNGPIKKVGTHIPIIAIDIGIKSKNVFLFNAANTPEKKESARFLKVVQNLKNLKAGQLDKLNIEIKKNKLKRNLKKGIF